MGTGSMYKLLPSSTGAILSSLPNIPNRERCRPAPLLNTNKRQAMPVRMPNRWNATIFYRLQSLSISLRETHIAFKISTFQLIDSDPTACHLSTFTHSFDILILSSLTTEHRMHQSHYSQTLYVVAVTDIAVTKS